MTSTIVQLTGSFLILVPFVLVQLKRLRPEAPVYIWLNLIGSTVLAVDAWHGQQWGFLLLEATWAAVSFSSLFRRSPTPAH
jgi:hypothetical protein